jgi:hypothetical protein
MGISPTMGKNSGLRPKVGISPYVTRSPTIGKSFSNHLPALIAGAVTNGLPTIISEEASIEGSGQPTEGFPEEPLAKGVSISVGSLHPTSTRSEISTTNIVAAKDISILCLQLVTRAQAKIAAKELIPGEELPECYEPTNHGMTRAYRVQATEARQVGTGRTGVPRSRAKY